MYKWHGRDLPETPEELCMLEIDRPGEYANTLKFIWHNTPRDFNSPVFMWTLKWLIIATRNRVPHAFVGYSVHWTSFTVGRSNSGAGIHLTLGHNGTVIMIPETISDEAREIISSISNYTGEEYTLAC